MSEKLSTRVYPPTGEQFTCGSASRIAASLAREYGDVAVLTFGRDEKGPYIEASRSPQLRVVQGGASA